MAFALVPGAVARALARAWYLVGRPIYALPHGRATAPNRTLRISKKGEPPWGGSPRVSKGVVPGWATNLRPPSRSGYCPVANLDHPLERRIMRKRSAHTLLRHLYISGKSFYEDSQDNR